LIRWSLLPLPPAERREKEAAMAGPKVGDERRQAAGAVAAASQNLAIV